MFLISKTFDFSAGHRLDGLAPDHPCGRDHGHNYTVRIGLVADELDETGFVADFHRLAPLKRYLDERFDHRVLNDVLSCQPSSERLAQHVFQWCVDNLGPDLVQRLHHAAVSETPTSWAVYAPGPLASWSGVLR